MYNYGVPTSKLPKGHENLETHAELGDGHSFILRNRKTGQLYDWSNFNPQELKPVPKVPEEFMETNLRTKVAERLIDLPGRPETVVSDSRDFKSIQTPKGMKPVARTPFGDHFFQDAKTNKILFRDHETNKMLPAAASMSEFKQKMRKQASEEKDYKRNAKIGAGVLGASVAAKGAGGALAGLAGRGLMESKQNIGGRAARKFLDNQGLSDVAYENVSGVAKRLKQNPLLNPLSDELLNELAYSKGPAYFGSPKTISTGSAFKDMPTSFLGHEAGHAKIHRRMGKAMRPTYAAGALSLPILAAGGYKYFKHRDSDPEKAKKWRNRSLLGGGLTAGAVLAHEGGASLLGRKMLKNQNMWKPGMGKELGKAFGTYAGVMGAPLAIAGGAYGIDALMRRRRQKELEKQSSVKDNILRRLKG